MYRFCLVLSEIDRTREEEGIESGVWHNINGGWEVGIFAKRELYKFIAWTVETMTKWHVLKPISMGSLPPLKNPIHFHLLSTFAMPLFLFLIMLSCAPYLTTIFSPNKKHSLQTLLFNTFTMSILGPFFLEKNIKCNVELEIRFNYVWNIYLE